MPALTAPSTWAAWLAARDPLDAVFAVARAALIGVDLYLLAVTVLALLVRLTGAVRAASLLEACTVPFARGLVRSLVGIGLAVSTASGPALAIGPGVTGRAHSIVDVLPAADETEAETQEGHDDAPLLWRLPRPSDHPSFPFSAPSPAPLPAPRGSPPPASLTIPAQEPPTGAEGPRAPRSQTPKPPMVKPQPLPATPKGHQHPPEDQSPQDQSPDDQSPDDQAAVWEVRSGDHLWAIAEATLSTYVGPDISEAEIRRYWRRLIDVNRERFADPDNPDFIVPGQVFSLPAVTA